MITKNRGAISNPEGRFEKETRETFDDGWDSYEEEEELLGKWVFKYENHWIQKRLDLIEKVT